MTAFVLSAALAFVIYEILAFVDVPAAGNRFKIRDITIAFDEVSARWARRLLWAGLVALVLLATLFIHEIASPTEVIAHNPAGIVLGFFFGPLLAIWVNAIFVHPPGQNLSRGQIVGGIGLIVLFVVGSVGDEAVKVIQQYARNLQTLKLGGAELSFLDRNRKDESGPGANQLVGSSRTSSSAGLLYLSQLSTMIKRDERYLDIIAPRSDAIRLAQSELQQAQKFVDQALEPPIRCLAAWSEFTADAPAVNRHLESYARTLRSLTTLDSPERRTEVGRELVDTTLSVASDIVSFPAPSEVDAACEALVQQYCPIVVKDREIANRGQVRGCLKILRERVRAADWDREDRLRSAVEVFTTGAVQRKPDERPYFAIGYASLLAQLGSYDGAGATLDAWIQAHRKRISAYDPNTLAADHWFEIRARSIMAAYTEEWITRQTEVATALLNYHLQNLDILRASLRRYLLAKPYFAKVFDDGRNRREPLFKRPSGCMAPADDGYFKDWQQLFGSYLSMERTHAENALRHPDYKVRFAEMTSDDLVALASMDLSCVPASEHPISYVETLEVYARSAVTYSRARAGLERSGTAAKRLNDAEQAARLGLEIIQTVLDSTPPQELQQGFLRKTRATRESDAKEGLKRRIEEIRQVRRDYAQ